MVLNMFVATAGISPQFKIVEYDFQVEVEKTIWQSFISS